MSANLINLRTIQFSDKFALLSQQYGSRLQSLVGQGQYQGKPDTLPWDNPQFKGDKVAWESAIKKRTEGQNEYSRGTPAVQ